MMTMKIEDSCTLLGPAKALTGKLEIARRLYVGTETQREREAFERAQERAERVPCTANDQKVEKARSTLDLATFIANDVFMSAIEGKIEVP